jgi:hypothetical protein
VFSSECGSCRWHMGRGVWVFVFTMYPWTQASSSVVGGNQIRKVNNFCGRTVQQCAWGGAHGPPKRRRGWQMRTDQALVLCDTRGAKRLDRTSRKLKPRQATYPLQQTATFSQPLSSLRIFLIADEELRHSQTRPSTIRYIEASPHTVVALARRSRFNCLRNRLVANRHGRRRIARRGGAESGG